jgi:hypothetical protein
MPSLSGTFLNPGNIQPDLSSIGGSATGDWFIHNQFLNIFVERQNVYNTTLSSIFATPIVTSNRLKVKAVAGVTREIEYDATFSGSLRQAHQFSYDSSAGGAVGTYGGYIFTSQNGIVRRLAQKNSAGVIIDDLTSSTFIDVTFYIDAGSGAYDPSGVDPTDASIAHQAAVRINEIFPNFKISLLDL